MENRYKLLKAEITRVHEGVVSGKIKTKDSFKLIQEFLKSIDGELTDEEYIEKHLGYVSSLGELHSHQVKDLRDALELFVNDKELWYFVYEIHLGRSPQSDMRTYEYIGAYSYETKSDVKRDQFRWQYTQTVVERDELL